MDGEYSQSYLMRFGYLPKARDGAFALRTEESIRTSLSELQQFAGIPVTGRLDGATINLLKRPRCGLPDKIIHQTSGRRKRFTLQGEKWPYLNLTWSLRTKKLIGLDYYEVRSMIAKAFEVWSRHSKLTFTEVDNDGADILIYFYSRGHGDNFDFDGRGVVLAHAFFPNGGKSTDVHFDADESWTLSSDPNEDGTNFFNVAAHEFGHSLGLAHSSVDTALMYPWYKEIEDNGYDFELPDDDRNAIQTLYGTREDRIWARIHPERRRTSTTTTQRTTRTWRTYPTRPMRPPERQPPRRPYDPRYPNGINPSFVPYSPKKPGKQPPYYPQKPTYHDKKPNHNPYKPAKKAPYIPPHPTRSTAVHQNPDKITPKPTEGPKNEHHHHQHDHHHPQKESPPSRPVPNTCDTSYDAISVIRREVFIFKGAYFWRIGEKGLMDGYPAEITRLFRGFPHNLTHVDAVYERPDNKIVFFVKNKYYLFTGNRLEYGYPRPLTDLGLSKFLTKIDGAMVWGHNGKTYFFSGNMYWRFDEESSKVELDYPRDMTMWKGVGQDIDSVFQWKDGRTYFFKNKSFWKFNDNHMKVEHEEPKLSAPFWMGCSNNIQGKQMGNNSPQVAEPSSCLSNKHDLILVILALIATKIFGNSIRPFV